MRSSGAGPGGKKYKEHTRSTEIAVVITTQSACNQHVLHVISDMSPDSVITPVTASHNRNCGVSPPGTAFHKRNCELSVSQKNCVLQRLTKETATLDSASHKKNCLN